MNEIIISNIAPQDIVIGEGGATGITAVYVNGVDVTVGSIAYVIVPTKTSELINDSGFITSEQDPTVPNHVKQITISDINRWNSKQDELVSGQNIKTINNQSILGNGNLEIETEYTAGTGIQITDEKVINNTITSYNDLTDLPTIPTSTSQLTNDSDFVTSDALSEVAFTGKYDDLLNTPDLSEYITKYVSDLVNYYTKDFFFKILPKVSGSGTSITLDDTIKGSQMYLALNATELSQDGTPSPSSPQDIHTISGSNKVVVNGINWFDGEIEAGYININTGADVSGSNVRTKNYVRILPNTEYTISDDNQAKDTWACYYDKSKTFISNQQIKSSTKTSGTFTTPNNAYYIRWYNSASTGTSPLWQLQVGDQATTYTPYVSQTADVDLGDIECGSIGNYENIPIRTSGKNLFKIISATDVGQDAWGGYGNGTYTLSDNTYIFEARFRSIGFKFSNLDIGESYTLSFDAVANLSTNIGVGVNVYNGSSDSNKKDESKSITTSVQRFTFTFTAIQNNVIAFNSGTNSSLTNLKIFNIQLEKGTSPTSYEPYGNGEWYLKQEIGKVVLDGSENVTSYGTSVSGHYRYAFSVSDILRPSSSGDMPSIVSDHYVAQILGTAGSWEAHQGISIDTGSSSIFINDDTYYTQDSTSYKNWLSTHNVTCYYVLDTPTYTPITGTLAEQLENVYNSLISEQDQTNISQVNNDLPFTISATTLKDLSSL